MADRNSPEEESAQNEGESKEKQSNSHEDSSKQATESQPHAVKTKIDVLLKAAGDAPIMKKKKWAVERTKKISWISEFIKKYLKFEPNESMFLYVNQSFAPSPDTEVGSVFECFGSDGKLVLHYCKTQAWG